MPKDWETHRTELERLYITERKTLDEVKTLLMKGGFDASIRAYRMKFDEWGFRKYKARKNSRQKTTRLLSTPKVATPEIEPEFILIDDDPDSSSTPSPDSDSGDAELIQFGEIKVPGRDLTARELATYIPPSSPQSLEIVLAKWRAGRQDYRDLLDNILSNPLPRRYILFSPLPSSPLGGTYLARNMFDLIKKAAPREEHFYLFTRLLRADRDDLHPPTSGIFTLWAHQWRAAASAAANYNGSQAIKVLSTQNIIIKDLGEEFFRAAVMILLHPESLPANSYPTSILGNSLPETAPIGELRTELQSVAEIAGSYAHPGSEAMMCLSQKDQTSNLQDKWTIQDLEAKLNKYRKLLGMYTGTPAERLDEELDKILESKNPSIEFQQTKLTTRTGQSSEIYQNANMEDRTPYQRLDLTVDTLDFFQVMLWVGKDAGKCVDELGARSQLPLPFGSKDGLLDIIIKSVPPKDHLPLAHLIIDSSYGYNPLIPQLLGAVNDPRNQFDSLKTFSDLLIEIENASNDWPGLKNCLQPGRLKFLYDHKLMSPAAIDLFIEAVLITFGQDIIDSLQMSILSKEVEEMHYMHYVEIMKVFEAKGLDIPNSWSQFLSELPPVDNGIIQEASRLAIEAASSFLQPIDQA